MLQHGVVDVVGDVYEPLNRTEHRLLDQCRGPVIQTGDQLVEHAERRLADQQAGQQQPLAFVGRHRPR